MLTRALSCLRPGLLAGIALLLCAGAIAAQDADAMLAAYQRAERALSGDAARLVYKASVEARWIGDTHKFWYRNDVRGEREFVLVDADAGAKASAFDHERIATALSAAVGQEYDSRHLPFTEIRYADDLRSIRFVVDVTTWTCDLDTYQCAALESPPAPPAEADGGRPRGPRGQRGDEGGPPGDQGRSPDGKWDAFARDYNLWLRAKDTGEETQLTTDGVEDNAYTAIFWSPDSRRIVVYRTVPGDHLEMYTVESSPADSLRPKLHSVVYDLPGDKLDVHEMWLLDVEARTLARAEVDKCDWWGPNDPHWEPDGRHFMYRQIDRGFRRYRVIEVDFDTGASRTVIDEPSETFIAPDKEFLQYLDASGEIIWASERDGWNHLYLYDAATGEVKNQITKGEWVMRGVDRVDEDARRIWFHASGMDEGRDPYLVQYFSISFDGTGLVRLTEGDGSHRIDFSPDSAYYVDSYSRVDLPPTTELRRSSDGSLVTQLEEADVTDLIASGWRMPEPFVAKGRDGTTDIWGVVFRPSALDESAKYPVVENIYAGPQGSFVPKTFSASHGSQAVAELGFIVVQIDGMGTANRSRAFHAVADKNLGDSGFTDRILWMKAAAERYPYIDTSRVGLYGMSAGGYNAAHALIAHPEFYKVAVAMSGNHDHRTDKVWWNELWMGYPVGEHYAEQSNTVHAAELQGKLLLVHGELDDNVNPSASTLQFVNALIKANKDFDLLIVPGAGHEVRPYVTRRMWDYFVRNLQGVEPPHEYAMSRADSGRSFVIRNLTDQTVSVYWVNSENNLQKYHDLQPGAEVTQHSYLGHSWVATTADGTVLSRYTVADGALEWAVAK